MPERELAAGVGLAHGVRHGQEAANGADDDEQGIHHHRERQQEDASDAQDQPDDEHAEGREQQDLAQQAAHERAPERMRDRVGDDLEIGPPEHHQAEPQRGHGEEHPDHACRAARHRRHGAGRRLRYHGTRREHGCGSKRAHLAADFAPHVPHVATQRQDVTRYQASGMQDDVALDRHQVAHQAPVDIRIATQHQQVSRLRLGGSDAVITQVRRAAGDVQSSVFQLRGHRIAKVILDLGGIAQIRRARYWGRLPRPREPPAGADAAPAPGRKRARGRR